MKFLAILTEILRSNFTSVLISHKSSTFARIMRTDFGQVVLLKKAWSVRSVAMLCRGRAGGQAGH